MYGVLLSALSLAACGESGFTEPDSGSTSGPASQPAVNQAPVARAGSDQSISIMRAPYGLNASSSRDSNGDPLTFTWTVDAQPAGASITLTGPDTATPSFESLIPGEYTFSVTVEDDAGLSSTDSVVITLIDNPPIATAGANRAISITPDTYELDASGSRDPNGDLITFAWSVVSQPPGVGVVLSSPDSAITTFESMVPGAYEFSILVEDEGGNASSNTVVINLRNDAPDVTVAFDQTVLIGDDIPIDTTGTTDPNGHAITYSWELISTPDDSGMAVSYTGDSPILRFDAVGFYTLELTVSDGYDDTVVSWNNIYVTNFTTTPLDNFFTDAEYDAVGQRIVTLFEDQVFIIDPSDGSETSIDLPQVGIAVSVAPDGATAAVAHDASISHLDLNTPGVLNTWAVPEGIRDVVIDGSGYAYGFPSTDLSGRVQVLDLATGVTQQSTGSQTFAGTLAKLHPDGDVIYAADNDVSPSDVERFSVGAGAANLDTDSPYHGDFPFCGDLWIDFAGDTMLTRCRVIVRTTDDPNTDMTYVRTLNDLNDPIRHASNNPFDDAWYVIEGSDLDDTGSTYLQSYDLPSGNPIDTIDMPYHDDTQTNRWIARFVFADNDSQTLYVLAVDNEVSFQRYALLERIAPAFAQQDVAPTAVAPRYLTQRASDLVTIDGSSSSDPEGQPLTYQWTLVSQPAGSTLDPDGSNSAVSFTPTVAGTYEFSLVVNDGSRDSLAASSTVNVFDIGDDLVHRLEGDIDDVEYSKALDALVYLTSADGDLHIMNIADFSETTVALPYAAYRVGISPDGLFAAVSHAGMASLIDLTLGTILDSQTYIADWGDIVLDNNQRAHIVPVRDQGVDFVSLDFANDLVSEVGFANANTQLRMHPVSGWVYGANRGLSPADFEKWDVSAFPSTSLGDSPYHGDYDISGNIWISETGDRLLVAGAESFLSSADAMLDMTHAGGIADDIDIEWADHSSELGEWVVASSDQSTPILRYKLIYYEDALLAQQNSVAVEMIPTTAAQIPARPRFVFFNDDGTQVIAVIEATVGLANDPFAVQITAP